MRAASLVMLTLIVTACHRTADEQARLIGGDPQRGRDLIRQIGCGSCHTIPGIASADAKVGPPLADIRDRVYIAGVVPNTVENALMWIQHPQSIDPRTAMPDMGVSERDARDILAYLYTR